MDMTLKPVGVVHSPIKEPSLVARTGDLNWENEAPPASHADDRTSEIIIHPEYIDLLHGVEDFSHLLVLYWAHKVDAEGRRLNKVHPMGRKDLTLVGVFGTCSPARPNPILVIPVKIVERKGRTLRVTGLDAVDGSPVIDIKPYLPSYYSVPDAKLSAWMNQLMEEMGSHVFVDKEMLLKIDPDIIFIDGGGLTLVATDYHKNPSYYRGLKAFSNQKVYTLLPFNWYTTNIGTVLADAFAVGKRLYPEPFEDMDPEKKADAIYTFLVGKPVYRQMKRDYGPIGGKAPFLN